MDVLRHDGDTLSVDGAKVGVLKKTSEVGLRSLLKGHNGRGLESEISFEILSDLTNKSLEGQLADQKLSGFLITSDLTKSDGAWAESVGTFDASSGGGRLASSLSGELLAGGFASG